MDWKPDSDLVRFAEAPSTANQTVPVNFRNP
jgi:hypothetical protein